MRRVLVSWNSEDGFQGDIVAYYNLWTGEIISKEAYNELVEREIFDLWHTMDKDEQLSYGTFDDFRKTMLNSLDDDFMPLVEHIIDD